MHIVLWNTKFLNRSFWCICETLTGTTIPGQSGLGSNVNEGVLHNCYLQNWSLMRCSLVIYLGHLFSGGGGLTYLQWIQSVYSKPHWQGVKHLRSRKKERKKEVVRSEGKLDSVTLFPARCTNVWCTITLQQGHPVWKPHSTSFASKNIKKPYDISNNTMVV